MANIKYMRYIRNFINKRKIIKENLFKSKELLDNVNGYSLDKKQRLAVIDSSDSALLLAGAGSGKTLTIVGKIRYLIEILKIKKEDFEERTQKKNEADRRYLFPVVIFVSKYEFNDIKTLSKNDEFELKKILNDIYEVVFENYTFYLTSIGIFIDNYIDTKKISRRRCIEILEQFLNTINKQDFYAVSYATDHFYVRTV